MPKTLEMIFENTLGKNARVSVPDPKEDLDPQEVKTAMDAILAGNIFTTPGGDMEKILGARIVSREVEELELVQ
jgi:hypothetical protein